MVYKNTEEFDLLLKEAVIREFKGEINSISFEEFLPSKNFQEKMNKLFKTDKRETFFKKFSFYGKRVAMIILIIFGLLATLFTFNEDVRAKIETIIEWFEDHTKIQFYPDGVDMERKEFDLNIIPKEYKIKEIDDSGSVKVITLVNEEDQIIRLTYRSTNISESMAVDNEYHEFKDTKILGVDATLIIGHEITDSNILIWEIDGLRFDLDGEVPVEEIIDLAKIIIKNF